MPGTLIETRLSWVADVSPAVAAFRDASVAVLATVRPDGSPHVVPVVFAVAGDTVYTGIDAKPKSGRPLARLANIAAQPAVSLLCEHYAEDWSRLWWVRADGTATVHDAGAVRDAGVAALRAKYPQYERVALDGPVIEVRVRRWASWHGGQRGAGANFSS
jgi:PPOX class probable F420-dependent enzyme